MSKDNDLSKKPLVKSSSALLAISIAVFVVLAAITYSTTNFEIKDAGDDAAGVVFVLIMFIGLGVQLLVSILSLLALSLSYRRTKASKEFWLVILQLAILALSFALLSLFFI